MSAEINGNEYLTVGEVAEILKVKSTTVTKWIKNLGLPARKFGTGNSSPVRIVRSELDVWVNTLATGGGINNEG